MATLFFLCPVTGCAVSSGIDVDPMSYAKIDEDFAEISCPHCKEPHPLASVKNWLEDPSGVENDWT